MNPFHNYKLVSGFTIKPSAIKPKRTISAHKPLTKILYCLAIKTEKGWKALINTKGVEGYQDITVLDFTEKSFELKGRTDVFYHEKDKTGHYIRVMRDKMTAYLSPGCSELYCALCNNSCFSGYIVKVNNVLHFDMLAYKGSAFECSHLLSRNNNKNTDEEE